MESILRCTMEDFEHELWGLTDAEEALCFYSRTSQWELSAIPAAIGFRLIEIMGLNVHLHIVSGRGKDPNCENRS